MSFPLYLYRALPIRVVDGDSLVLRIDLGFKTHVEDSCRLFGTNAPEVKGATLEAGLAAKNWLIHELTEPDDAQSYRKLWIQSFGKDKYGRWLVRLWTSEPPSHESIAFSVNTRMVAVGHAVEYYP